MSRSLSIFLHLIIATAAIGLLLTTITTAVVATSPKRAIDAVVAATARFTQYEIELVEPSLAWSPLEFSAQLALLRHTQTEGPPLVAIQKINLTMSAVELITGHITQGQFTARNITYYLDNSSENTPIDLEALLSPLGRLPMQMEIASLHLISRDENISIFPLLNLQAHRNSEGSIEAAAEANVAGRPVVLKTRADWREARDGSHQLTLNGAVYGREEDSELRLSGTVNAAGPKLSYAFSLNGHYENVSDFLRAFDDKAYAFDGNMRIDGELRGDLNAYELTVRDLSLSTPDSYTLHTSGTLTQSNDDPVVLDLEGRGDAQRLDAVIDVPPELAAALDRSELQIRIGGTLEEPLITRAALVFFGAGNTRLEISSENQALDLQALQSLSPEQSVHADLVASTDDAQAFLKALGIDQPLSKGIRGQLAGVIQGSGDDLRIDIGQLQLQQADYSLNGETRLLWRKGLLSAPIIKLRLSERAGEGSLLAEGAIADVLQLRGMGIELELKQLSPARALRSAKVSMDFPLERVSGTGLIQRAADAVLLRAMDLELDPVEGLRLAVTGSAQIQSDQTQADLTFELSNFSDSAWRQLISMPNYPYRLKGQMRLRPTWATLISEFAIGSSPVQLVISADMLGSEIKKVAADIYSADLHIDDFAKSAGSPEDQSTSGSINLSDLRSRLPDYPLLLTLRSDLVSGPLSRLETFSLAVDIDRGRVLLRELDTRYAGGELTLRGLIDLTTQPAALSLAGQGFRVPLGELTRDLGLQQEVKGAVSLRGGLSTRGVSPDEWRAQLQGRVATAFSGVTVSGAAYDLLMSNILAWVVQGAGAKTTTFDCSMAQFDINQGVARSDSLYIETPRMLATGKAIVDLPENSLDVRIEPRSKTRAFQFPSAVRVKGPLNDPKVSISELQATADLSAQALLLLPSLTLRLFGIGGDNGEYRPCEASAM